jgi:sporulation protein YlmC with PRC-barrel domain
MPVNDSSNDIPSTGLDNEFGSEFGSSSDNGADKSRGDDSEGAVQHELFVSGLIYLVDGGEVAAEIRRGMTILTTEGEVAGTVAGVVNNIEPQQVKYILLSRPSQQIEYRLVPIELVQQVSEETVSLHILAALLNTLPPWRK